MSGDPDVLEYYKNDRSKKPLRVINLNLCEEVGVGVTFNKKKLQHSFVFSIRTSERVFYLVAKTEEDMNKWVQSICQICDFIQAEKRTDSLRNISLASHGPCSSPGELSSSSQHLPRERKSSAPLHSGEPTLFTFQRAVSDHVQSTLSASAPQEYLYLHQCISQRAENARNASFSQGTRASFFRRSGVTTQKPAYVNVVSGQVHGFHSLPKPSQHSTELRESTLNLPQSLASHSHTKGILPGSETDNEDVYTFKVPRNTLCQEFGNLLGNNMDVMATPVSSYQITRAFTLDKNHSAVAVAASGDSAMAPPPRPPKPSQAETPQCGSPQQKPPVSENSRSAATTATITRRNTLPSMDKSRLRASSCKSYEYPQRAGESAGRSAESMSDGISSFLPGKTPIGRSDSTSSEDNYVPMKPVSSTLMVLEQAGDNSQSVYIPMRPGPHQFDPLGYPSPALSMHRDSSPWREIQPPPVNRNLKPDRKAKPAPLNLKNNTVIDELPLNSTVTKSSSRAIYSFSSGSSQCCHPVQSFTSTDSGDEEDYVPMQSLMCASPIPSDIDSAAPKKSTGSINYVNLDFQSCSPSPHHKVPGVEPSMSSVTSDKVVYVQVDKVKTQALQRTMKEWAEVEQSSEPCKSAKQ